jgi:plasmid stabilization system protein ParE
MKVLISEKARQDLLRIHSYVSQQNPEAADAIFRRIDTRLQQLSRFPFIGRERKTLGQDVRGLLAGNYLIFHTVEPDRVTVVRVIDARMDIDEEFRR